MSMDKARYPANWKEISLHVRERAGWKCEWCDAPGNQIIYRDKVEPEFWLSRQSFLTLSHDSKHAYRPVKVILTVHHIGVDKPDGSPGDRSDKMDCRDENLVALCQRCHLYADLDHHIANAKTTRQRKAQKTRAAAGQLALFEDGAS